MTDQDMRERARQFNSAKLRQDLYTALDQWHRGGTGPQLEAVLPIITAIRDEAAAQARLEEARKWDGRFNGEGISNWAGRRLAQLEAEAEG
jgi:hypothetical protein